MKHLIIGMAIAATTFTACNNNKSADVKHDDAPVSPAKNDSATSETQQTPATVAVFPVKEILSSYLQLKNALANDNGKDAAAAGNSIVAILAKVDMNSLNKEQMKSYMDIADDLKENAEHIGANAGKIDHQREHFELLSKDITDLIKTFGNGGQTLYKDFCPMANDGKGAFWVSETKEIKNPYLGGKMPTCGMVKEELK